MIERGVEMGRIRVVQRGAFGDVHHVQRTGAPRQDRGGGDRLIGFEEQQPLR